MMSDIGSADHPIKVLFVPSVDAQVIVSGGEIMANALNEATGLHFEVSVPTSYAATIEEMCASPTDSMGFIPGLGYVLANQLCGVDVSFKAIRFGWPNYWAQILVPRDSDVQSLEDLNGLKWAYPDAGSTSGYLAILPMMNDAGVEPGETLEAGGHTGSVRAVYNGEADFATTFFSPPLLPEGEWAPGDDPDVPADLLEECGPNDDGSRLMCGDLRVLDARASLREEAPDVIQQGAHPDHLARHSQRHPLLLARIPRRLAWADRGSVGHLRRNRSLGRIHWQPGLLRLDRHRRRIRRGV